MITKDEFVNLIIDYKQFDKHVDELQKLIHPEIFENPIIQSYWNLFESHLHSHFDEDGFDVIMWWLLDKDSVYGSNPPEDCEINTIYDLWDYVKEHFK